MDKLPVEISDNELPVDDKCELKDMEEEGKDGGFVSTLFLFLVMIGCFFWGMLVMVIG